MSYDINDFEKEIIQKSHSLPVLVDFWAEWCGPCKILGPVLEDLAQQSGEKWLLAKLNTEQHPTVAAQYGIKSIPNVKLFVDGKVIDEFTGALPKAQVIEWLAKALPSKYRVEMENAQELLAENKISEAKALLKKIIDEDPLNEQALVLLAQAILTSDSVQAIKLIESINVGSKYFEAAEAIRTIELVFQHINEPRSLPEDGVKDSYLNAIREIKANNFERAITEFIQIVQKNRNYDNDGARKICVSIFNILGNDNPITKKHRRALSSALF